jgi:hypothetical protein
MAINLANLLLSGGTLWQANYLHNKTMEKENQFFKEEMTHMEEEHKKVLVLCKLLCSITTIISSLIFLHIIF